MMRHGRLKRLKSEGMASIWSFLDPPYRFKNGDELMLDMAERGLLEHSALVVLEYESSYNYAEEFGDFHCIRTAKYGETAISIYRYDTAHDQASELDEEELHDDK